MSYIKKEFREKLYYMDYCGYGELPSKWNNFVDSCAKEHNLIIKSKDGAICTNCGHEFITNKDIGKYEKCPNCKNKYLVKSSRLKKYTFWQTLILLDKIEDDLVFRYFDLESYYDNKSHSFNSSAVEFARSFLDKNVNVVNERLSKCTGAIYIHHKWGDSTKWRPYERHYGYNTVGYIYPYNLDEVLQDTKYRYIDFQKFIKNVGRQNFEDLFQYTFSRNSFEMLTKLGLYNLALNADKFYNLGTFQSIFGISKDYYSFIKKYNLNYQELKILQLLKQKDIRKVRYLAQFNKSETIKEICENYINIDNLIKYVKMNKGKLDFFMYEDYLRFAKMLDLDLKNKKYMFPNNLKQKHDELEKSFKLHSREILNEKISNRYTNLKNNTFKDKYFVIFPAKNVEDLENESKEQHNCVRTYAENYANR